MAKVRRAGEVELKPNIRLVIVGSKESSKQCGILGWFSINRTMTGEELLTSVLSLCSNKLAVNAVENLLSNFDITHSTTLDFDFWNDVKKKIAESGNRVGYWQSEGYGKVDRYSNPFDEPDWMRMSKGSMKNRGVQDYYNWPQTSRKGFNEKWSISATLLFETDPMFIEL